MDTVRLFVGCSANGEDAEAQAVLEYTARRSSLPIEITWMTQRSEDSIWQGWNTAGWATPFSGYRWGVPAACDYTGRALYSDVDVVFVGDLAELWRQDMSGSILLRKPDGKLQTCVMLFDCERCQPHFPKLHSLKAMRDQNANMRMYFAQHREELAAFAGDWNAIDLKGYQTITDPQIKAIHYSSMAHQPHLRYAQPRLSRSGHQHWYDGMTLPHWRSDLVDLFDRELRDAARAGFTVDRYVPGGTWIPYVKKSWSHYIPPVSR